MKSSEPSPRPLPEPAIGTATFDPETGILTIRRKLAKRDVVRAYLVEILREHPAVTPGPVLRMRQASGESYVLAVTEYGAVCECWDAQTRRANVPPGLECKHIRAALAAGLLGRKS